MGSTLRPPPRDENLASVLHFHGKTNESMDSNHSSTLFSRRMNPSRTENRLYPAAAFVNGGSLSDSLCMGMFQARMYWHQKEDIEISER
ncbi:hypothetical protein, partial [Geobacillus stearothermophilus]|uniref:hypothetical protein n=1 Tax=Geobacillus stearothermophilus TaxID=1422 RepID=UPI001C7DE0F8